MPRLVLKDTELLKILTRYFGFVAVRQRGSHVRLRDNNNRYVTISIHNKDLKQGTLIGILNQAGLSKGDIEEYL
jgi:predicted RNA binding protein YcfA (HicA-like mRNA interferase family)